MLRLTCAPLGVPALANPRGYGVRVGHGTRQLPILRRFLSAGNASATGTRALRHLEAHNDKFDKTAWMDVWTEVDATRGFRSSVASSGGSPYIREHVMLPTLETERKMWSPHGSDRAALTPENYTFADRGVCCDGLATFDVKPRRKDMLLVDGSLFVRPEDGELVRLEGQLVKSPSFWTRHVHIVRWYQRIAGIRMPVAVESDANVLIAGQSTFRMTYKLTTVNGQQVGSPRPRH